MSTKLKFCIIKTMGINEDLRVLLLKEFTTIKDLAKKASEVSGKTIAPDSISAKLLRGTMKYDEAKFLGGILGYDLEFVKRKNQ